MEGKSALITGISGQDGSYLAELLLSKGYTVYGLVPHRNAGWLGRCAHLEDKITWLDGDITDACSVMHAVLDNVPDEIYHLAAMSFVAKSWKMPAATYQTNLMGTINVLEAARLRGSTVRVYVASSSEMFGHAGAPQNENTPLLPCSPYGVSKVAAHLAAKNYRESFGMFVSCGILFNHESPRRGNHFVTQKIARAAAAIASGTQDKLYLGRLDPLRDWGHADEYVEAMWLMLQQDVPDDFVIGTGESYTVKEFCQLAFECVGLNWQKHVEIAPALVRPVEVMHLQADASKANSALNWRPRKSFDDLVKAMVGHWRFPKI
jgi:GDPmannose 4,6-dehydratase